MASVPASSGNGGVTGILETKKVDEKELQSKEGAEANDNAEGIL